MAKFGIASGVVLSLGLAAAVPTLAQQAAPAAPAAPPVRTKNPAEVPAGVYNLDLNHQNVTARIGHAAMLSFSVLRFGISKATLTWDPANPAGIKVEATIDTTPHYAPIKYNVPPEGELFLNSAMFPTATFVSTSVRPTGASTAEVTGDLTLKGVTKPVTMKVELVGAGRNNQGKGVVGFTGTTTIDRHDWGITFQANTGREVQLTIDGEFVHS